MGSAVTYTPRWPSDNRRGRADGRQSEPKCSFGLSQPKNAGCCSLVVVAAGCWLCPVSLLCSEACCLRATATTTTDRKTRDKNVNRVQPATPCPKITSQSSSCMPIPPSNLFGSFRLKLYPFNNNWIKIKWKQNQNTFLLSVGCCILLFGAKYLIRQVN